MPYDRFPFHSARLFCSVHECFAHHASLLLCVYFADFLLEKVSRNYEVARIKSIGGAAQVRFASVNCQNGPIPWLNRLHVISLLTLSCVAALTPRSVAAAGTRLVENQPNIYISLSRLTTTPSLSTLPKCILPPQYPRRPRHLLPLTRRLPRSRPRGPRPNGLPRRHLRTRIPHRRTTPPRP